MAENSTVLFVAGAGDFLQVEVHDPIRGKRTGFMKAANARWQQPQATEASVDLSVPPTTAKRHEPADFSGRPAGGVEPLDLSVPEPARKPEPMDLSVKPGPSTRRDGPRETHSEVADRPAFSRQELKRFRQIQLGEFAVSQQISIPDRFLELLGSDMQRQLSNLKKFTAILGPSESILDSNGPALRLDGTITEYQPGNRAVRYLVGFGAGKAKIVAHITVVDVSTSSLMLEDDVDGLVVMGAGGGDSAGATNGLAKEIAKVIRQRFF